MKLNILDKLKMLEQKRNDFKRQRRILQNRDRYDKLKQS